MMLGRSLVYFVCALGIAVAVTGPSQAQTFPSKPISITVTQPPGGAIDFATRVFASAMSKKFGQQVLVENRPAGGGLPAAESIARSKPDGHNLIVTTSTLFAVLPVLQEVPFDPKKDFTLVGRFFSNNPYMVTSKTVPAKTVAELVDYSKTKPGGLNFGNVGTGYSASIMIQLWAKQTGAKLQIVNYTSNGALLTDLAAGRVDFVVNSLANWRPAYDEGKVNVLAVVSNAKSTQFPDAPPMTELGYPEVVAIGRSSFGLAGAAGMPANIVKALNEALMEAGRDPEVIKRLGEQDLTVNTTSPEDATKMMYDEIDRYRPIIKELGLKLN